MLPGKKLNKQFPEKLKKDEILEGYYDETTNTINVSSDLTEDQQIHIFFHELNHYVETVTHRLNEEGRCDAIGAYMAKLMEVKTLEGFLSARKQKRSKAK